MDDQKPLVDKNIKGLRLRDLIILISCTATVVASILGVKDDISDMRKEKQSDDRLIELRVTTLETNVKALNSLVDALRTDIISNRRNIELNK